MHMKITTLPDEYPEAHSAINVLRLEYVVSVEGTVRQRPDESINKKMKTGTIEVAMPLNACCTCNNVLVLQLEILIHLFALYDWRDLVDRESSFSCLHYFFKEGMLCEFCRPSKTD